MMVISQSDEQWDSWLKQADGTLFQSSIYADYMKAFGETPVYLRAEDHGKIVGQLLMLRSSRLQRRLKNKKLPSILSSVLMKVFPFYHVFYGSVASSATVYSALVKQAIRIASDSHIELLEWIPSPLSSYDGFGSLGFEQCREAGTFLVSLRESIGEIWLRLDKHSARKNVERAEERGVTVELVKNDREFCEYFAVLNEGKARSGLKPVSYAELHGCWSFFHERGVMECFLARKDGVPLAGIMISMFNGCLHEWGAGHSTVSIENKLYANDLLKWHVFCWGKERGASVYDLSGVNPNAATEKERNIFRFKQKWGGRLVCYPIYRYPRTYQPYKSLHSAYTFLKVAP